MKTEVITCDICRKKVLTLEAYISWEIRILHYDKPYPSKDNPKNLKRLDHVCIPCTDTLTKAIRNLIDHPVNNEYPTDVDSQRNP